MVENIKVAILLTVFNRKDVTLKGLELLEKAIAKSSAKFDIYMTDDNSTDDTSTSVASLFPDVKILKGNGSLFWGGGMNMAWKEAVRIKKYDGYIWFNDDSYLYEDALNELLCPLLKMKDDAIICGAFQDKTKRVTTYGGKLHNDGEFLKPNGLLQEMKYMNGNFVFIPRNVFEEIGYIDDVFRHSMGDYDYGLRALKKGFKMYLTKNYVGECERHDFTIPRCYNKNNSLIMRLKALNYPIGPDFRTRIIYTYRHKGLFAACIMGVNIIVKTFFPVLYKNNRTLMSTK